MDESYLDQPVAKGMTQTLREYREELRAEVAKLELKNVEFGENEWRTRRLETLRKRLRLME